MIFLGLDQSARSFGICILESGRNVPLVLHHVKPQQLSGGERLVYLRDTLRPLIERHAVTQAAFEGYSYGSVGRTFELGEVGGMVKMLLVDLKISYITAAPAQLKKFVTRDGAADKEKVRDWVMAKWNQNIPNDDEADAYGFAKLAEVYTTGVSSKREEFEVVHALKQPKTPQLKPAKPRGHTL